MRTGEAGFTLPMLLLALALAGAALAGLGRQVSTAVQREKEAELRFRGQQFVQALARYRAAQQPPQYPATLDELLVDTRGSAQGEPVRHHLRRLYQDPHTGRPDWELVHDEASGRIRGVRSRATRRPFQQDDGRFVHDDASPTRSSTP